MELNQEAKRNISPDVKSFSEKYSRLAGVNVIRLHSQPCNLAENGRTFLCFIVLSGLDVYHFSKLNIVLWCSESLARALLSS